MASKQNAHVQVAVETEDKCIQTDSASGIAPDPSIHAVVYTASGPDFNLARAYEQSVPIELMRALNDEPSTVPMTFAAEVAQQRSVMIVRPGREPDDGSRALLLTNIEMISPDNQNLYPRRGPYVEIRVIQPEVADVPVVEEDDVSTVMLSEVHSADDNIPMETSSSAETSSPSGTSSTSLEIIYEGPEQPSTSGTIAVQTHPCSVMVMRADDPRSTPVVRERTQEELQRIQMMRDAQRIEATRRERAMEELKRVRAIKKKKDE